MRIFLAGATGVIGRRLVPLLAGRGHSVTGLVRRPADANWLRSLGANAVVAMRFDSSEIGQQLTEIVAYGSAVVVRPAG